MAGGTREEETEAPAVAATPLADSGDGQAKGQRSSAYANMRRELSDKELQSPGIPKILLHDNDRLRDEVEEYKAFFYKFHESEKELSALREKVKAVKSIEVLSGICMAGGGVLLGLGPKLWDNLLAAMFIGGVGLLFIIGGVVSKVIKS